MGFKKHAGAKITAIIASVGALIATLVLVQQNPPPATASGSPAATPVASRQAPGAAPVQAQPPVNQQQAMPPPMPDTRSRGS